MQKWLTRPVIQLCLVKIGLKGWGADQITLLILSTCSQSVNSAVVNSDLSHFMHTKVASANFRGKKDIYRESSLASSPSLLC